MNKAIKIKGKRINNFILSIGKTTYLYDVLIETRDIKELEKIKKYLEANGEIIEEGIYGNPLLVLDTCESENDARYLFTQYIEKIRNYENERLS